MKSSDLETARTFVEQNEGVLTWRKRGEFRCWFVSGRVDEYGIEARKVIRTYLTRVTPFIPGVEIDDSEDRVDRVLEILKRLLSA